MKAFVFRPDKCDVCRQCEVACSAKCSKSSSDSAGYAPFIKVYQSPQGPFLRLCKHCEDTPCVDACIGESLKCGNDGIIIQDEKRCIGCFMCNMVCPHGAIKTVMSLEKAFKCTLICGEKDNPPCVAVCDREALFFDDFSTTVKKRRNRKIKEIRGLIRR